MAQPAEKPVVLSWLAQANWQAKEPHRTPFEVLVRHFFARLLSSATLNEGDDASVEWIAQTAYAAALPTLLFALYLFPAYHSPLGKPPFWVQATHHFFFVDASFALMGLATVLEWDLLFPDPLDALMLTPLPIQKGKLLRAKVFALAILLGGLLLWTSCFGIVFFPGTADLPNIVRHFAAHAIEVLMAGLCAIFFVVAVQTLAICCCGRRLARTLEPLLQTACVLLFTMSLVLEPVIATLLHPLLTSPSRAASFFPPFWFFGMYEHLLGGSFAALARTGLLWTGILVVLAIAAYPVAYARKTRQAIEGAIPTKHRIFSFGLPAYRLILKDSRSRAIYAWIGQTLPRTPRTRLLLAFFAALVLALPAAVLMLKLRPDTEQGNALLLQIARLAIPMTPVLTIAGLRIALRAPVAKTGAWAFRVMQGRPNGAHLAGAQTWVTVCACFSTVLMISAAYLVLPPPLRGSLHLRSQIVIAFTLPVLFTDLLFMRETTIPFTEPRVSSVNDLSFAVSAFFVLFPVLAFALVAAEPWIGSSWFHCAEVFAASIAADWLIRLQRNKRRRESSGQSDMEEEPLLPGEIGLRSY